MGAQGQTERQSHSDGLVSLYLHSNMIASIHVHIQ